ncbi:hypothetical protein QTP86_028471, partial [Hemibagrus guttatus]
MFNWPNTTKRRKIHCVVMNTAEYLSKDTTLEQDHHTNEKLKRDLTSNYRKKVLDYLKHLDRDDTRHQ